MAERFITPPNVISLSRLALAAAFLADDRPSVRVALLATAAATDFLDGFLARRVTGWATRSGMLIDAIADRLFVLAAVCALLLDASLSLWQYVALLLRDAATAGAFAVAHYVPSLRHVQFQARYSGKVVTVLQLLTLTAALVWTPALAPLAGAVAFASLVSIADYTRALWRARRQP